MPKEHLGLYDTPPDRRQVQISVTLVGIVFAALGILSIRPDERMPEIDAFIPMVDAVILLGDLITATLLYVEASVFRSRPLIVLASGYVITGLLLVAHMLSFPGAFAPIGLLGEGINTTALIAYFWRATLPISIIVYVVLRRANSAPELAADQVGGRIAMGLSAAILIVLAITLVTTLGHDLLPPVFLNRVELNAPVILKINLALLALLIVALGTLFVHRRSVLDMWLLVALATWIAHALLNIQTWGRFTLGFYSQFIMLLFSHFVVMLALIAETNRLYARLAISTAARSREREARLMSMDAVAAAISHEAGQPLSAVILNANAGLNWLTRRRPDRKKAIESLRATIEDSQRTFDVIKSIRAMFASGPGSASEFSLNDLVRDTALALAREMTAAKVSLELDLDEALPPILASRVQVQRVIMNLLTNAIESVGATRRRPRRIAIRTLSPDGRNVQLEIADNGAGIAPEKMPFIFDAFFTTKSTGRGLGLSLCRTIVEEHGGRLWATSGDHQGANFYVQLPSRGLPEV